LALWCYSVTFLDPAKGDFSLLVLFALIMGGGLFIGVLVGLVMGITYLLDHEPR
jgi:hypothetical protein